MLVPLLPASAAPFAPRASSVSVVLGSKVEPWLTKTLKRINREEQRRHDGVKQRRLNSVPQQQRYLTDTLSSPNAIWTLTSINLPKTPEADFKRDANNSFAEAAKDYKATPIKGYVVHIDMILHHEVTYKLTKDTIKTLTEHHKEVCRVEAANDFGRPDMEQRYRELHEDFVQAINNFIFRTKVSALEGLEEGGTGKLLEHRGNEVKGTILSLMKLPRPRAVDAIQQNSVFPMDNVCSQPGMPSSQPAIELWKVPPSGSSVAQPASTDDCLVWVPMAQCNPAPAPACPQLHSATSFSYTSPQETALISAIPISDISAAAQCGVSMEMSEMGGSYSFGLDRYQKCAATIPQEDSLFSVVVSSSEYDFFPSFMPKALVATTDTIPDTRVLSVGPHLALEGEKAKRVTKQRDESFFT